jgi:hypothetical protein
MRELLSFNGEGYTDLVIKRDEVEHAFFFQEIEEMGLKAAEDYIKQFYDLMPHDQLRLSHIGFLYDDLGSFTELHYDWEMVIIDGKVKPKPFVGLVYLNDDFEGGELHFPYEQYTIKPEAGKIAMFPCSFTFPHVSIPVSKGAKHLMRLTFEMDQKYYHARKIEL